MGQGNSAAGLAPQATTAGGAGSLSDAFNTYQGANDQAMGLDTLSSQYADQKGGGADLRQTLTNGLMGIAQTKMDELTPMKPNPMSSSQGGYQDTQGMTTGGGSMQDIYNKMMQQQFANWQNSQVSRYKGGVLNGR
jgi:hypothetical protein